MRNRPDYETKALDRAAGLAGKADDERFFDDNRQVTGEDGVFGDLHRFHTHDFAEARQLAKGNFAHGFRSYIAQSHASAASCQNELAALGDMLADGTLNVALFIGDEGVGQDFPAIAFGCFFEGGPAEVVIEAARGAIGNSNNANVDMHERIMAKRGRNGKVELR